MNINLSTDNHSVEASASTTVDGTGLSNFERIHQRLGRKADAWCSVFVGFASAKWQTFCKTKRLSFYNRTTSIEYTVHQT